MYVCPVINGKLIQECHFEMAVHIFSIIDSSSPLLQLLSFIMCILSASRLLSVLLRKMCG